MYKHQNNVLNEDEPRERPWKDERSDAEESSDCSFMSIVSSCSSASSSCSSSSSSSDNEEVVSSCEKKPPIFDVGGEEETLPPLKTEMDSSNPCDAFAEITEGAWFPPKGSQQKFRFTGTSGVNPEYFNAYWNASPYDIFRSFVDEEILSRIVDQTNLSALRYLRNNDLKRKSRFRDWVLTNKKEQLVFLGLIAYMGLVRMPHLHNYWSKDVLYANNVASERMSRNRFELLLHFWHFSDDENSATDGDLSFRGIQPLIDTLVKKFQYAYTPGEVVYVDESVIPFQSRSILKRYVSRKRQRYGMQVFKVRAVGGYTWNMKTYAGKEMHVGSSVPSKVVTLLTSDLLNHGRIVVTDHFSTNLELADHLLDNNTHLLGMLRINSRGNPAEVTSKKLQRGEMIARENARGITVIKWHDKRDVLVLSTCHSNEVVTVHGRDGDAKKPKAIVDYGKSRPSNDVTDRTMKHDEPIRRNLKWHRRTVVELLLDTTVVNAYLVHKMFSDKLMSLTNFREIIVKSLLAEKENTETMRNDGELVEERAIQKHMFQKMPGSSRDGRRYCRGCYDKKIKGIIGKNKVKKVTTYCSGCEKKPRFCLDCFNQFHS